VQSILFTVLRKIEKTKSYLCGFVLVQKSLLELSLDAEVGSQCGKVVVQ